MQAMKKEVTSRIISIFARISCLQLTDNTTDESLLCIVVVFGISHKINLFIKTQELPFNARSFMHFGNDFNQM